MEPYLHQIMPFILTCMVGKRLGVSPPCIRLNNIDNNNDNDNDNDDDDGDNENDNENDNDNNNNKNNNNKNNNKVAFQLMMS